MQILKLDKPINQINLVLWLINLGILIYYSLFILIKYIKHRKDYEKNQKNNVFTWGIYFYLSVIVGIEYIFWRFILEDNSLIILLSGNATLLVFSSVNISTWNVERGINRSGLYKGYYFFPVCLITTFFSFILAFYPIGWLVIIDLILVYIGWSLLPLVFFYLAKKTVGGARMDSLKIAFGTLITLFGLALQSTTDNPSSGFNIAFPDLLELILMMTYPCILICGMTLIFWGIYSSLKLTNY